MSPKHPSLPCVSTLVCSDVGIPLFLTPPCHCVCVSVYINMLWQERWCWLGCHLYVFFAVSGEMDQVDARRCCNCCNCCRGRLCAYKNLSLTTWHDEPVNRCIRTHTFNNILMFRPLVLRGALSVNLCNCNIEGYLGNQIHIRSNPKLLQHLGKSRKSIVVGV